MDGEAVELLGVEVMWTVEPLTKKQADALVTKRHYSRRASMFQYAFGLIENGKIEGVVVYGSPPLQVVKHALNGADFLMLELTRLVIQTKEKNAASFLIGRSLTMLPQPCAVVSYADTEFSHAGIVYQATNWLYTGATKSHDHMYLIDGKRVHPRTLASRGITNPKQWAKDNGIETVPPMYKHRYFFFNGNKKEKKALRLNLKYPVITPYPKMDQNRYDDGERVEMHLTDRNADFQQSLL